MRGPPSTMAIDARRVETTVTALPKSHGVQAWSSGEGLHRMERWRRSSPSLPRTTTERGTGESESTDGEFDKAPGWLAGQKCATADALRAEPSGNAPYSRDPLRPHQLDRPWRSQCGQKTCVPSIARRRSCDEDSTQQAWSLQLKSTPRSGMSSRLAGRRRGKRLDCPGRIRSPRPAKARANALN